MLDKHGVVFTILERIQALYEDEVDLKVYEWDSHRVEIASVALRSDPSVHLLFTLGSEREDVIFVSPTSADTKELGGAIARVETHFAKKRWHPHYGHVAELEHPYLAERGRVGVITASPMALAACEGVPETVFVGERRCSVIALVWLDAEEMAIVAEEGAEALDERWKKEGRDFVTM